MPNFNWPARRTPEESEAIKKNPVRKRSKFKPNRAYIDEALSEYLRNGGKITILDPSYVDTTRDDEEIDDINPACCGGGRLVPRNYPIDYCGWD